MGQYIRQHSQSSLITSVAYDEFSQLLEVIFCKGGIYEYAAVNSTHFEKITEAESFGVYFNEHIKGKHKYRKVRD
jgi:hypothetical protein